MRAWIWPEVYSDAGEWPVGASELGVGRRLLASRAFSGLIAVVACVLKRLQALAVGPATSLVGPDSPNEYLSADPSDYGMGRPRPLRPIGEHWAASIAWIFNILALPMVAVFLAVAVYVSWPSETVGTLETSHRVWTAPIVLLSAALVIAFFRVITGDNFGRRRKQRRAAEEIYRRTDTDVKWLPISDLSINRIVKGLEWADGAFTREQQGAALSFLLSPSKFTIRLGHTISSSGQMMSHEVVRRIEPPNGFELKSCPIPIYRDRKGQLAHRFKIKVSNTRGSTLSSFRGQALTMVLLTHFIGRYLKNLSSRALWSDSDWLAVLTAVGSESPVRPESPMMCISIADGTIKRSDKIFADILRNVRTRIIVDGGGEREADAIIQLISDLAQTYIVWVTLPADFGRWCHVETEYCTRLDIADQSRYEKARVSYGLASRSIVLPLELSRESQSYHLHLAVPDETYVYRTRVSLSWTKTNVANESENNHECYPVALPGQESNPIIRTSRPGTDVAHVYTRGVAGLVAVDHDAARNVQLLPSAHFEFREIPPGNLIWAILISSYVAGLSWTVNFYFSLVFPENPTEMGPIWTTLLFGIPAILAGFLLSRFTKDNLKQSSFVTLGLLIASIMNAFALMCVSVLIAHDKWRWTWNLRNTISPSVGFDFSAERTIESVPWAFVVVSSTTIFVLAVMYTIARRSRFTSRLRGKVY